MFRSLQHDFVCIFSPLFLLVCLQQGFPTITVDKFKKNPPQICAITFSKSCIRMCGQMLIRAVWHQCPTSCCSSVCWGVTLVCDSSRGCASATLVQPHHQQPDSTHVAADPGGGAIHMHRTEKSLPWPSLSNNLWICAQPSGTGRGGGAPVALTFDPKPELASLWIDIGVTHSSKDHK